MRVGGIISFKTNGVVHLAKGEFTYNIGAPKRSAVVGSDGVHGFTEEPQVPFIEGKITDRPDFDYKAFVMGTGVLATLELANGKTFFLRDAWYAAEGTANTKEGEIDVRYEGMSAEEIS
jgi:hypothetical protein